MNQIQLSNLIDRELLQDRLLEGLYVLSNEAVCDTFNQLIEDVNSRALSSNIDAQFENINTALSSSLSDTFELNPNKVSQKTIVLTLNKILSALKKIYTPVILILAMLFPQNGLSKPNLEAFDYDGIKTNHMDVIGEDNVYTADEIDKILKSFNGLQKTVKRYPVFCIDLNTDIGKLVQQRRVVTNPNSFINDMVTNVTYDMSSGESALSPYISFELKASTNNFRRTDCVSYLKVTNSAGKVVKEITNKVPGLPEEQRVLYWCASEMGLYNFEQWDSNSMLKFGCSADESTADYNYLDKLYSTKLFDYRSWKRFNSISELDNISQAKIMVILDYTKFKHTPDTSWCNSENKDLVWCYTRFTINEQESDVNGNPVWRPIIPIMWLEEIPAWAYTNNEVRVIHESQL